MSVNVAEVQAIFPQMHENEGGFGNRIFESLSNCRLLSIVQDNRVLRTNLVA
jgi:hypothetical protein